MDTFTDAVRRVANGGSALDPEVVALLLGRRRREDPLESLTAREREVLGLMAEGRSNNAIAEALVVTERAVEKHVTSIFSKLDLPPTVEDHRRVLAVLASRTCAPPRQAPSPGAVRARAHARAGVAARRRHVAPPGAADGARGVRDHGRDRRGAGDRARDRLRGDRVAAAGRRRLRLRAAGRDADRGRDRRLDRRVVAAIPPARRAAKVDVLRAGTTE